MSRLSFDLRLQRGDFELHAAAELPLDGVIGIIGPSGAGKSSLLRGIAGLETACKGQVIFDDATWLDSSTSQSLPTYRRGVGMVFQQPALFDHLNVRQNLDYARRRAPSGSAVPMGVLIEQLGIESLLERPVTELSGGEAQRVALARALTSAPRLLLLDEPLAAVDIAGRRELMHCLEQLRQQRPVPMLYVSHNLDEVARLADQLLIMDEGRILAQGSVRDLLTRLDLPLAQAPDAEAILEGRVTGHDEADALTRVNCGGVEILLGRQALPEGSVLRMRIQARDVSLALSRACDSSILNILECRVLDVAQQSGGHSLLRLQVGEQVLLARITQRSLRGLGIGVGRPVYAQIKSVALA